MREGRCGAGVRQGTLSPSASHRPSRRFFLAHPCGSKAYKCTVDSSEHQVFTDAMCMHCTAAHCRAPSHFGHPYVRSDANREALCA